MTQSTDDTPSASLARATCFADDEIWVTRDGRKIPVGDMTEEHVRNTLRMIIRKTRRLKERRITLLENENLPFPDEQFFERPDNHQELASLRAKHGNAVRVEPAGVAGMHGGNVYINDVWHSWMGGI